MFEQYIEVRVKVTGHIVTIIERNTLEDRNWYIVEDFENEEDNNDWLYEVFEDEIEHIEEDFWKNFFLRRVQVCATREIGTIIDLGSVEGTFIIELDMPKEGEIYFLQNYHLGAFEFIDMPMKTLIDKYMSKMSDRNLVYRYTLIELVRRGYKRVEARKMLEASHIGDRMFRDPIVFWHYDECRWADWVILDTCEKV